MSPRPTSIFACQACAATSPKWLGRCPECGEWNSFVEERRFAASAPAPAGTARATPLLEVAARPDSRIGTGLAGLDRVLGGGIVPGSVVLLGGEPGIGKSTLLLQASRGIASGDREVL